MSQKLRKNRKTFIVSCFMFINILEETEEKIFRFFLTFTVIVCWTRYLQHLCCQKGTAQIHKSLANEICTSTCIYVSNYGVLKMYHRWPTMLIMYCNLSLISSIFFYTCPAGFCVCLRKRQMAKSGWAHNLHAQSNNR